ncbi:MAG: DUF2975 domain-containing protein [Flavobacterium sp.]|nr:DUF2975 domain-containing protein [Flavobacterium sp.]
MSTTNNFVFKALHIVAWIIFVALCIEAGALIVNFVYSLFKPQVIQNLYQKLNLSSMYNRSQFAYFAMYSLVITIAVLKAYLFYIIIKLVSKINLQKPFSNTVAKQITQISYYTFAIGLISYIARQSAKNLQQHGFDINTLNNFWVDSEAFILMAAIIYVIAIIFSKGIELQEEKDLTI